jgi:NADH-quinone oxidoreductase subunit D
MIQRLKSTLEFDGDILTKAQIAKGDQVRPIWKKLERLSPAEMVIWVDRLDSLCAIACEWALAQAIEEAMGVTVGKRAQFVRTILCEINRLVWLTSYLGRMTQILNQRTLSQQVYALREQVFVMQEELTGGRILPQALAIGGTRRELALGDVQKVRQFIQGWKFIWQKWTDLVMDDPLLEARLRGLLVIETDFIEQLGWWGIVGKASGVNYDSRKHRPHGAYMFTDFQVPTSSTGDAKGRFDVAVSEVNLALTIIDNLLKDIPSAIQPRSGEQPLKAGIFFGTAESAKGPLVAAVEVGNESIVAGLRVFSSGQRVWPRVDQLFHDIRAEDFQLAFASLGVDAEESEV